MATGAPFAREYLLSSRSNSIELVRIRRRLERINVQRKRVKLFVTVATLGRRIRQRPFWPEVSVRGQEVPALIERSIAHQVCYGAMANEPAGVKIAPVLYANQIRYSRWKESARSLSRAHAWRDRFEDRRYFFNYHLFWSRVRVTIEPGRGITSTHEASEAL